MILVEGDRLDRIEQKLDQLLKALAELQEIERQRVQREHDKLMVRAYPMLS